MQPFFLGGGGGEKNDSTRLGLRLTTGKNEKEYS